MLNLESILKKAGERYAQAYNLEPNLGEIRSEQVKALAAVLVEAINQEFTTIDSARMTNTNTEPTECRPDSSSAGDIGYCLNCGWDVAVGESCLRCGTMSVRVKHVPPFASPATLVLSGGSRTGKTFPHSHIPVGQHDPTCPICTQSHNGASLPASGAINEEK
jgi:hypothetical protein